MEPKEKNFKIRLIFKLSYSSTNAEQYFMAQIELEIGGCFEKLLNSCIK